MPWKPAPAPSALSRTNGERSRGQSSPESKRRSSQNARTSGLHSATIALAHESSDGCERGDRRTDGVPVWACRAEESRLPNEPENTIGRLTQVQDESITSVDARVPGSGAQNRKTGAQTPPGPRKREQRRPRVDPCRRGPNRGRCRLGARRTDFSAANPRTAIGRLTQMQDETITSVDARVPGSGCAKMRKPGQTPPRPAKREQRRPRHPSFRRHRRSSSGPRPGRARPLAGGDRKYQKEFDHLREYDHLV